MGWLFECDARGTGVGAAGEAGAVSHDLCVRVSGSGNGRPDGEMKVLGFRLHIARPYEKDLPVERVKGEIMLGNCRISDRYSAGFPCIYADALCRESGRYRFRAAVATDFQTAPSFGVDEAFDFRPGEPAGAPHFGWSSAFILSFVLDWNGSREEEVPTW